MALDPRDSLWDATFDTYYDAYYEEIAADALINRWQLLDEVAKVVVALTASGSAVAGWALWNDPAFRTFWVVLAGLGAILAIVHATLGVPGRLKTWGEIKRAFVTLRIDLETFRYRMEADPAFDVGTFQQQFEQYRKRYTEAMQQLQNDILLTSRLENAAQDDLNARVKDKTAEQ
jgi:hypothetical protein